MNFSSRLAKVCARRSKSLSEGVSASRYQPVESLETRRRWRGRRRGEEDGVLVGVVVVEAGVLGRSMVVDFELGDAMKSVAAGRPFRKQDAVFMVVVGRPL